MNKYLIGRVEDFPGGVKKRVMAGDLPLMVVSIDGKYFATEDTCTHAKASLSSGKLDGFKIECAWHGAKFDIRTGKVLVLPAAQDLKTFHVYADGDDVWVDL